MEEGGQIIEAQATEPLSPKHDLAFWQNRWESGQTGWDLGGPHPLLGHLMAAALDTGWLKPQGTVLEPGAGRAHNGAALARRGFSVVSFDGAQTAIQEAKKLYGKQHGLTLLVRDALEPAPDWTGSFDAIFDRAMLCALQPEDRRAYLRLCFDHLRPDGLFLSLPFTVIEHGAGQSGPPFALSLPELTHLFAAGFALVHAEERTDGATDGRIKKELVSVWRRRKKFLVEAP